MYTLYPKCPSVFLCAEPPMLQDAVTVLSKNLEDPLLALLVSRIVDERQGLQEQVLTQHYPSTNPVLTQYYPSTNPVLSQYQPSTNPVLTQY